MIAPSALQLPLMVLTGWLERREREALAYPLMAVLALLAGLLILIGR